MNKKSKIILSSALSIAMSACVAVGGTFALFTAEDEVNIAVTAGHVAITATASGLETYSYGTEANLGGVWTNGGAAVVEANSVELSNITPGDEARFTVSIANDSNIKVIYRTIVEVVSDTGLMSGLEITVGGENFVGYACSEWKLIEAEGEGAETVQTEQVTITLPKQAGNEYFDKTARLVYKVEAVQSNAGAGATDYEYQNPFQNNTIRSAIDLKYFASLVNAGKTFEGETVYLVSDIDLDGKPMMPIGTKAKPFLGTFKSSAESGISTVAEEDKVYTVSNFVVNNVDCGGLFGYAGSAKVRANIENVAVENATINANRRAGGIVGQIWGNVRNCTVSNTEITVAPQLINNRHYENGDKAGGIAGYALNGVYTGNAVKNVAITAYRDIGGVAGVVSNDGASIEVKVADNEISGLLIAYDASDIQTYEDGEYKVRGNAKMVVGKKVGTVTVENNAKADVVIPSEALVNTEAAFAAAVANGGEITVQANIETKNTLTITKATNIDLDGNTISCTVGRDNDNNRVHALVNESELTIVGGTIKSAGVNGGSAVLNNGTFTGNDLTLVGAPQSGSTWPSYTVNNYGVMALTNCEVTGYQGVIATNGTAVTTVENTTGVRYGWGSSGHVFYTEAEAKVTINGGTYENRGNVDGTMFTGGETVVNDGTFLVSGGAYFALNKSLALTVNGGDFTNVKSALAWGGTMTITGGAFGFNPTNWVAESYQAVKVGATWAVMPAEINVEVVEQTADYQAQVDNAIAEGKTIVTNSSAVIVDAAAKGADVLLANNVAINANNTNGYGKTGLNVNGGSIDGNGNTFGSDTANGTWDSAICVTAGTVKNVKVVSGFRGVFIKNNAETVYLDNLYIDGTTYTISCDQGGKGGLVMKNSTLKGWTSYAATIGAVSFTNCNFGAGNGYSFCRPYAETVFEGCNFEAGYKMDPRAAVTLINCYYDGVLITSANLGMLIAGNTANVTVANN
jgi:predicted ribosomally synthesized peptide with SipW-like signal peptide